MARGAHCRTGQRGQPRGGGGRAPVSRLRGRSGGRPHRPPWLPSRIPGVFAHQIDDLHRREVGNVRGLPVTTPARTFVDLVVVASPDKIRHALEGMIVADRITTQRIGAVLGRIARPGKPRLHVIASILDELGPYREGIPESVLEKRVVQLVRDADVGEPHVQHPFPGRLPGRCRCDVALPPPLMIVEADGRRWHARMEAMSTDRLRDQTSGREGWHTTRFTWDQLEEDYEGCIETVRATYEVRMAQLGRPRVA